MSDMEKIIYIPLSKIIASPKNPRKTFNDKSIKELADSIRKVGLINAIRVQKLAPGVDHIIPKGKDMREVEYEIITGERRFRACSLILAEDIKAKELNPQLPKSTNDVIACLDMTNDKLSETDIIEMQIIENKDREDVHPIEEAEAINILKVSGQYEIKDIASKMGKSIKWVADRMKLLSLVPEVRQEFANNKITIGHANLIASLTHELQLEACNYVMYETNWNVTKQKDVADKKKPLSEPHTIETLKNWIKRHVMINLSKAVFDIKDKTLYEKAGACTNCQFNTGCNNSLFDEMQDNTKVSICTLPSCFNIKVETHVKLTKEKVKLDTGKDVKMGTTSSYSHDKEIIVIDDMEKSNRKDPKAIPVMINGGDRLGEVVYLKKKTSASNGPKETEEEKKKRLAAAATEKFDKEVNIKTQLKIVSMLLGQIRSATAKLPTSKILAEKLVSKIILQKAVNEAKASDYKIHWAEHFGWDVPKDKKTGKTEEMHFRKFLFDEFVNKEMKPAEAILNSVMFILLEETTTYQEITNKESYTIPYDISCYGNKLKQWAGEFKIDIKKVYKETANELTAQQKAAASKDKPTTEAISRLTGKPSKGLVTGQIEKAMPGAGIRPENAGKEKSLTFPNGAKVVFKKANTKKLVKSLSNAHNKLVNSGTKKKPAKAKKGVK